MSNEKGKRVTELKAYIASLDIAIKVMAVSEFFDEVENLESIKEKLEEKLKELQGDRE